MIINYIVNIHSKGRTSILIIETKIHREENRFVDEMTYAVFNCREYLLDGC